MTQFLINGKDYANGEMSVSQRLDNGKIVVHGQMSLNKYFEEIFTIDTSIYGISGVTVIAEAFGTTDSNVVYEFIATTLQIDKEAFNKRGEK